MLSLGRLQVVCKPYGSFVITLGFLHTLADFPKCHPVMKVLGNTAHPKPYNPMLWQVYVPSPPWLLGPEQNTVPGMRLMWQQMHCHLHHPFWVHSKQPSCSWVSVSKKSPSHQSQLHLYLTFNPQMQTVWKPSLKQLNLWLSFKSCLWM